MDFADSRSERFVAPSSAAGVTPLQDTGFGATAPMPPLAAPPAPSLADGAAPTPGPKTVEAAPAARGTASVSHFDQERLAALQDRNWRRVRALLWVLAAGVALGFLLLIPAVHAPPPAPRPPLLGHIPPGSHAPVPQRPL